MVSEVAEGTASDVGTGGGETMSVAAGGAVADVISEVGAAEAVVIMGEAVGLGVGKGRQATPISNIANAARECTFILRSTPV